MKTKTKTGKNFIILAFLALLLFNGSALRGEDAAGSTKAQSRLRYAEMKAESTNDPEMQNHKSRRYAELEWLILQSLMKRYQKMEVEILDDLPD
jgi:hypothetical protein